MKKHLYYTNRDRVKMIAESKLTFDKNKLKEIQLDISEVDLEKIKKGCTTEVVDNKLSLKHIKAE